MADRQRDEDVVLQRIVVEEISGAGAEVGDVERPAGDGNRQAKFVLLIPFTVKGSEIETQKRTGDRQQWRGLIITSVIGSCHPIELRNTKGRAYARIGGVLTDCGF